MFKNFYFIGKVGKRITLHRRKPGPQGANQRWVLTKEGYIALESHPQYVINVKGSSLKEGSHVVLSDSSSKSFAKSNFAKWEIDSLNKDSLSKERLSMYLNYFISHN